MAGRGRGDHRGRGRDRGLRRHATGIRGPRRLARAPGALAPARGGAIQGHEAVTVALHGERPPLGVVEHEDESAEGVAHALALGERARLQPGDAAVQEAAPGSLRRELAELRSAGLA